MNTNNQTDSDKSKLSVEQKQKMKKYGVFALMGIIFAGCMWFIFAPSADDKAKEQAQTGFNTEIPDPDNTGIIGDKQDAYEQEQMQQKQAERMRSLADFSELIGEDVQEEDSEDLTLMTDDESVQTAGSGYTPRANPSIQASAMAYNNINRSLGNFYDTPEEDTEKEELKQQLEELQARMDETESRKNATDQQLELMEKSFQMAAKYMPGTTGTAGVAGSPSGTVQAQAGASGKTTVTPVAQVHEQVVSLLAAPMSNEEFLEQYSQPRNMSFLTAAGAADNGIKNTIAACIYADQTITEGQNVRLCLMEPMRAGSVLIPQNTVLSAAAKVQGDRLDITVQSIESGGVILPVSLTVYDLDGQSGIFIPNLQELDAVKEVIANMGSNAGTSINLSDDAGRQFVADMGRNLIQGVSQFTSRKLREVKVHLKAGYKVLLLPNVN